MDESWALVEQLTPRERECLRLVSGHLSSKEIARQLAISQHTVDGHLDEARRKLGAATRRDAVRILVDSEGGHDTPPNSGGQNQPASAALGDFPPPSGGQNPRLGGGPAAAFADEHELRPTNLFRRAAGYELTPPQRLAAIVVIATLSALVLMLLLAGAHQFTFLIQRMTEGR